MKSDISLHADHQLDQLSGQFEHWRQTRVNRRERIPDPLWDQAVALTSTLSASRVAKHLRLGVTDLKQQIENRQGQAAAQLPAALGFVEVPPSPVLTPGLGSLEVEFYRTDGARLRIHWPDASVPLTAIVRSFLEA